MHNRIRAVLEALDGKPPRDLGRVWCRIVDGRIDLHGPCLYTMQYVRFRVVWSGERLTSKQPHKSLLYGPGVFAPKDRNSG